MGLFPVAGQNLFLLGSPFVKKAEIALFNGNSLTVLAPETDETHIYVKRVSFNGKEISDFRIAASELLKGGTLAFTMTEKP